MPMTTKTLALTLRYGENEITATFGYADADFADLQRALHGMVMALEPGLMDEIERNYDYDEMHDARIKNEPASV